MCTKYVSANDKPVLAYAPLRYLPRPFLFLHTAALLEYAHDLNNSTALKRPLFPTPRFSSISGSERNDLSAQRNIPLIVNDSPLPSSPFVWTNL